jgi:hypothetical protein
MTHKATTKNQRGVALITALLMTIVFLVLIGALMAQMIGELQDVGAHSNSAVALNAAYAGVENMVLQIEENASGPGHISPAPINYTYPSPSHASYAATVTNTWNTTGGLVYYQISSTGTETNSGQTRSVTALVRSFPYSYYEQFTAGNSGSVFYVSGEKFDGPVYNGGTMNVWYQNPSANPIFNNTVATTTMPNFYQGSGMSSVTYANVIWGDVASQGQTALQIGANPMQLPTFESNLAVASEAYYGNSNHTTNLPTPGANGLYINGVTATSGSGALATGLYIQGNVKVTPCSGTCGSYTGNNEVWTIQPTGANTIPAAYTVAIDFSANTTTVTQTTNCGGPCPSVSYSGVLSGQPSAGTTAGNGAIFVDGSVTLNSGTVHGDYSLTVPDYTTNHAQTITLQGSAPGVLYKDQSSTSTDELGIWANDIKINGANTSTGYEFDGSIITGYYGECPPCTDGTFSNNNYNNGSPQGTFTFYGGLIQNINGAMGISSGGTTTSGFDRKYKYDARLAANPPPGFPITNRYDIIAWLDEGQ